MIMILIISVLPKPVGLRIDGNTFMLSWTLQNSSILLEHQVFSPVRNYAIELTGGNCPLSEPVIHELQHNYNEISLLSILQLHSGANYSLRIKALGYHINFTSNFSKPVNFTTMPRGTTIIPCSYT